MTARKVHKTVGILLFLPFLCWAATGLVFFLKPGYVDAYAWLAVKTYPIDLPVTISQHSGWDEVRYVRTILGSHLIVRTDSGWIQLDPATLYIRDKPAAEEISRLAADAFSVNPRRYGSVARVSGDTVWTDTGVQVIVDWNTLSLQQRGKDTDSIDLLYRIHYLQWTGIRSVDKVLGFIGIVLVVVLAVIGLRLAFKK